MKASSARFGVLGVKLVGVFEPAAGPGEDFCRLFCEKGRRPAPLHAFPMSALADPLAARDLAAFFPRRAGGQPRYMPFPCQR